MRRVEAGVVGDERRVPLSSDGAGSRRDSAGAALPQLDGALDVDLPVTPFTNTLPIRRLDLAAGRSVDLKVAYVLLPEFQVIADPQRYVCLERLRRYRYESLDSDFARKIEVDADGLVVAYPG
ncbi:MAG: putative glycolipid-binding domain-containing protein, partial [Alphaproteobacteria bacterium]|nr:putative glycolipid-binding domain-containing protein [Alphaproteobacteria bacterium]